MMLHEHKDKRKEDEYDKSSKFAYPFHKVDITLCKKAVEELILFRGLEKITDEKV